MAPISEERQLHIRKLSNDEWVDTCGLDVESLEFRQASRAWDRKTERFLATATDPHELHFFVETYNWDKGEAALFKILQNPNCAAATALMIYWRGSPEFYVDNPPSDEFARQACDLIRQAEVRYLAGEFPVGDVTYDPAADFMITETDKGRRKLPARMYEPVGRGC